MEFRQGGLAAVAKERRDLLEHLLAGVLPKAGPLAAAAERYNLSAATRALVAVGVPLTSGSDHDALELAGATFFRSGLHEPAALVVVSQAEIVTIFSLGADSTPMTCARASREHTIWSVAKAPRSRSA